MANVDSSSVLYNPFANHVGYQLRRASAVMMAALASALDETGLKPTEATILMVVRANPGCIQSDIGRLLGIKRANLVPLIGALVQADLIERSRMDGRSQALHLTTAGEALAERVGTIVDAHEARYRNLSTSADEREILIKALRNVQQ